MKMLENSFSWIHQFCQFPEIHENLLSSIFCEYLWKKNLVWLSCIPHIKGLGMRILQYEIGNCQKIIIKYQWQCQATFIFCQFFQFPEIHDKLLSSISMIDRIIEWTPIIPHFKGLGMRNLQYEVGICQKFIIKSQCPCEDCMKFYE
jgi:hypothetical protein